MKTIEQVREFVTEKAKECELKIAYATELFDKLDLPEKALQEISYEIYENKGVLKAYNELIAFVDFATPIEECIAIVEPQETEIGKLPTTNDNLNSLPISVKLSTIMARLDKNQ